jgi:hypothetical protein
MDIFIALGLLFIHMGAGWYAAKLIKTRDVDAPFTVDLIIVLHGVLSLITTLVVQNLLFPKEESTNTLFLRDGMSLDLDNPEHREIYEKLKSINKK